jgi:branched-subunit amino acid aminotransferase/4-amino-4-deoxychorismate lyase
VWLDGRILPAGRARVSVFDRGLLFGDAAFETLRVYAGVPFLWTQHLGRLTRTLRALSIPLPGADLRRALDALLAACGLSDAAVRITVTRGASEALLPPTTLSPTVLLTARPIAPHLGREREQGVGAILLPFGRGRSGLTAGHKTTDYASAVIGRMRAHRRGAAEAIYVAPDGTVSEATTSNLFAVRGGTLLTPPLSTGCLPGITRQTVLGLARRARMRCREISLGAATLHTMDELFLTGSVIEIMPVIRLDRRHIGQGTPGPVTRQIAALYHRAVRRSCRP